MTEEELRKGFKLTETIRQLELFISALNKTEDFNFKFMYGGRNATDFDISSEIMREERANMKLALIKFAEERLKVLRQEFDDL